MSVCECVNVRVFCELCVPCVSWMTATDHSKQHKHLTFKAASSLTNILEIARVTAMTKAHDAAV